MGIRMTGMVSGLDTEAIISSMMEAQKTKQTKIENKITKHEWTTDIWKSLNSKLLNFYTKTASSMRLQSTYKTKSASSSDEKVMTATAGTGAALGTHKVRINNLASSQFVTGGVTDKIEDKTTRLTDAGIEAGTKITIKAKEGTADEVVKELEVTKSTTVDDFLKACKDAGLSASFDTSQKRFFISSASSGEEQKFSITTGVPSSGTKGAYIASDEDIRKLVNAGEQVDKAYEELKAADTAKLAAYLEGTLGEDDEDYEKIDSAYKLVEGYLEDADKVSFKEELTEYAVNGGSLDNADALANTSARVAEEFVDTALEVLRDSSLADYEKVTAPDFDINADDTTEEQKALVQAIGAFQTIKQSGATDAELYSAIKSYTDSNYQYEYADGVSDNALAALGLSDIDGTAIAEGGDSSGMVVVAAESSEIVLNGVTMKNSSNSFTTNGITFNLISETKAGDPDISITINNDVTAVYDKIKSFIKEYNEIVDEISTRYYAKSARKYDPLTSEQKEAMTDEEIEKWETKIKDSLLRRDSSLGNLMTKMRETLSRSYTTDSGEEYSLTSFGIVTSTYSEYGKLHLYGDSEDSAYGAYEDKLKKALEENPEEVCNAFTSIMGEFYSQLSDACKKVDKVSSALTFYNDKVYEDQATEYNKELEEMKEKLADIEERYYKQFTAMETMMSKLNSQANSLSSMLGISQTG